MTWKSKLSEGGVAIAGRGYNLQPGAFLKREALTPMLAEILWGEQYV